MWLLSAFPSPASSLCPASSPKKEAEAAPPAPVHHGQLFPLLAMRPRSHHPRHLCHHPLAGLWEPQGWQRPLCPLEKHPGAWPSYLLPR